MQTKYLNYGSSYLYALHGSGEHHIRKWLRERLIYCDTLFGYNVSTSDYITLRSSKLGEVYLDIQTYIPMYVRVKWRDTSDGSGYQVKRIARGETVRFSFNMPTATDQEIIVYAGHYLKSLGDVSNLQPTSMLIANADRLTEITCHSPNLINTDLSACTKLQKIDLSDCTALGTGIGAQPILNIQNCNYLRYCNCMNTKLTAIYTMQQGGNLEEIYYPETTQVVQLTNQTYLEKVGIPYGYNDLFTQAVDIEYGKHYGFTYTNGYREYTLIKEGVSGISVKNPIPVKYGETYTWYTGLNIGTIYIYEVSKDGSYINRPLISLVSYSDTKGDYTPTNSEVTQVYLSFEINNTDYRGENIFKKTRFCKKEEINVFKECHSLATVQINNCNAVKYLQYPFREGDPINFNSLKYVQNLTVVNSLPTLTDMTFRGFNKLRNVTLSSLKNLSNIGFDDMLAIDDVSTFKTITISDCPLIEDISFNVTSEDNKIAFAKGSKVDLSGLQQVKSVESNASIKGLDTLVIPTNVEHLRFSTEYGDGINEIKNIWSTNAVHIDDGFEGIDFQDMTIKTIDMLGLSQVSNAINFNISPIDQHPNMNTSRDGSTERPWFRPSGTLNLSKYTGDMTGMLRGIDLSLLDVVIDVDRPHTDLTGLFAYTLINNHMTKVNSILNKFPNSTVWNSIFKGSDITTDLDLPTRLTDVTDGFRDCLGITEYVENWNKTYDNGITADGCYTNTNGDLDEVPSHWGGYGFSKEFTTILKVEIPNDNYTFTIIGDRLDNGFTDWGDGTIDTLTTHTYLSMGTYIIKCKVTISTLNSLNNSILNTCVEAIQVADNITTSNYNYLFSQFSKLQKVTIKNITPTNCFSMFYMCSSLTEIIGMDTWDMSRCNDVRNMFNSCKLLTTIELNLNSNSYVNAEAMFNFCTNLQRVELYNIKPTNCIRMFNTCSSLTEIIGMDTWDMSKCTNMSYIFSECTNFTTQQGMETWILSNLTVLRSAFSNCGLLDYSFVENWNAPKLYDCNDMFMNTKCTGSLDLSNLSGSITNVNRMFNNAKFSTLNLTNIITSKVKGIIEMFRGCLVTEIIGTETWDVSGITNWFYAFNCNVTELNISGWNITACDDTSWMWVGSKVNKIIANNILVEPNIFNNWLNDPIRGSRCPTKIIEMTEFNPNMTNFSGMFQGTKLIEDIEFPTWATDVSNCFKDCTSLTSIHSNWKKEYPNLTDTTDCYAGCVNVTTCDGEPCDSLDEVPNDWGGYGFTKETTGIYVFEIPTDNYTLDIYPDYILMTNDNQSNISWGDGTYGRLGVLNEEHTHTYSKAGVYTVKAQCALGGNGDKGRPNIYQPTSTVCQCLIEVKQSPIKSHTRFNKCVNLKKATLYNLKPTDCQYIFSYCTSLTEIIGLDTWDISECDVFNHMFQNCTSLTNVTVPLNIIPKYLMRVFDKCTNLRNIIGINTWDISECVNLGGLFTSCESLTDLSFVESWNTSKCTDMSGVFEKCYSITSLDLSGWDTSKVKTFGNDYSYSGMFQDCINLTHLNLSNWYMSQCTTIANMFKGCESLREIIGLDRWQFDSNKTICLSNTFNTCSSLTSLDLSNWGIVNINGMEGTFNKCSSLTEIRGIENRLVISNRMVNCFSYCTSLTSLDLSKWDISNVTVLNVLFMNCSSLTSINISNWDMRQCTTIAYMFNGCTSLTDLIATNFNTSNLSNNSSAVNMFSNTNLLSHNSLLSFINALSDRTSLFTLSISLGTHNLSRLSDNEIAIATNKNYTIS